ncbi:MAG: MFS transporter [Chitinophagaceae bacterium]|nr:MFS transporter [Chitinophagaceae bacterium]
MIKAATKLYFNAYNGLSPSTWWLSLVMLVNRSGTMVVPFMTMYMTQYIHVGIGKAAFVMSLFGAGSIAGSLLGGKITDKLGYYYVQLFTLLGGGVMFLVMGQMKSYNAICITSFFLSMVNEAFRPANSVAIAHYSKAENRTRSYSLNRLAVNLGWAIGGALGGFIAGHNYQLLFWVDGFTNIAAAILLYNVLAPSKNAATQQKAETKTRTVKSVYSDYVYLFFVALQVLFAICFFQMFTILPVYYKTQLHLSESLIGLIMAFNGLLIALVEMVIVFRLEGRRPHLHYIAIGVLLVGLSYAMLNVDFFSGAVVAFLSMLVVTFGEMLSMPFMNSYWIARTENNNRGQYAGLFTVAWSMAQIVGPLAGGQIAEHLGYNILWWLICAACLLLSIIYLLLQNITGRSQ